MTKEKRFGKIRKYNDLNNDVFIYIGGFLFASWLFGFINILTPFIMFKGLSIMYGVIAIIILIIYTIYYFLNTEIYWIEIK